MQKFLFNLTIQERQVVLFLVVTAFIGIGINYFFKHYSQIRVIGYINQDSRKIELNSAGKQDLIDVPGIGEKLAERIIDYRQRVGKFKNLIELKNVKGIGESKYEAVKEYFY